MSITAIMDVYYFKLETIVSFASFDRRYRAVENLSHRPKAAATPTASFTLPLDLYNDVHVLAA
jgi:hypothetical protein